MAKPETLPMREGFGCFTSNSLRGKLLRVIGCEAPVCHPVFALLLLLYSNTPVDMHPISSRATLSAKVRFPLIISLRGGAAAFLRLFFATPLK